MNKEVLFELRDVIDAALEKPERDFWIKEYRKTISELQKDLREAEETKEAYIQSELETQTMMYKVFDEIAHSPYACKFCEYNNGGTCPYICDYGPYESHFEWGGYRRKNDDET